MDRLAGSKPRSGLPKVAERPHGMLAKQKGASLRLAVDLSLLYCIRAGRSPNPEPGAALFVVVVVVVAVVVALLGVVVL